MKRSTAQVFAARTALEEREPRSTPKEIEIAWLLASFLPDDREQLARLLADPANFRMVVDAVRYFAEKNDASKPDHPDHLAAIESVGRWLGAVAGPAFHQVLEADLTKRRNNHSKLLLDALREGNALSTKAKKLISAGLV